MRRNFTLIEMVSATAIMLMVAGIIAVCGSIFYNGYMQSQKLANAMARHSAIDRFTERYFRNAVPFRWPNTTETDSPEQLTFKGERDELYLCALNRAYPDSAGAFMFVRLYLDGNELKCDYSPYPLLPWSDDGEVEYATEVLSDGVSELAFRYVTIEDDEIELLEYWDEDTYPDAIPLAIQLELTFTNGGTQRWLKRTAGSSFFSTLGARSTEAENAQITR